jgi:molybdopterin/thiamine biosynthesis adenylyltransferase
MNRGIAIDRHASFFDPDLLCDRGVDIIGCGAVGGFESLLLGKLGIQKIRIFDPDTVSYLNLGNQVYRTKDIGKLKVRALKEILWDHAKCPAREFSSKVEGLTNLNSFVFMAVDSMHSRKEIWEKSIKMNPHVELLIDTRMGDNVGRVFCVNPKAPEDIEKYESSSNYSDEESEEAACANKTSVGPTACILAGWAVWQFMRWFTMEKGDGGFPEFQIDFGTQPPELKSFL